MPIERPPPVPHNTLLAPEGMAKDKDAQIWSLKTKNSQPKKIGGWRLATSWDGYPQGGQGREGWFLSSESPPENHLSNLNFRGKSAVMKKYQKPLRNSIVQIEFGARRHCLPTRLRLSIAGSQKVFEQLNLRKHLCDQIILSLYMLHVHASTF